MVTGSCLCGGVTFELTGALRPSVGCHCIQCRKTSGHYVSATLADPDQLHITKGDTLTWYRSSAIAQRGFCMVCGSSLFWRGDADDGRTAVMSGTLDSPTGISTSAHIYTAFKGDYYTLDAGVPQRDEG